MVSTGFLLPQTLLSKVRLPPLVVNNPLDELHSILLCIGVINQLLHIANVSFVCFMLVYWGLGWWKIDDKEHLNDD